MPWALTDHSWLMNLLLPLCSLVLASVVLFIYVNDYRDSGKTKIEDVPSVR